MEVPNAVFWVGPDGLRRVESPGEFWARATLVRVVAPQFVAGILLDPDTDRAVVCAPILGFLRGARVGQLRSYFARMGYRATVVRRSS